MHDPSNMHYWLEGGAPVPAGEIPPLGSESITRPTWEQLGRLEALLAETIAWYEVLVLSGAAALPACRRDGLPEALASAYRRVRELKGRVAAYAEAVRRVPRNVNMF